MHRIELTLPSDKLSSAMDMMRIWLDSNKVSAQSFSYEHDPKGMIVVVPTFDDDVAANAFAKTFGGKLQ
jgi:hypothetical protein